MGQTAAGNPVNVFLYNAQTTSLVVTYLTTNTYGTLTIPATNVYQFTMASDSGARFYTADGTPFEALTTIDTGTAYDWSATLIPVDFLSTVTSVGYGPGSENGTVNGSPVWVVATKATTLYVDYDGNPATGTLTDPNGDKYNIAYTVAGLQPTRVRDASDNDQTGMKLYTLNGVNIVCLWGEDPSGAGGGRPYIDGGTALIPLPRPVIGDFVWTDLDADGVQDDNEPGIPGVQLQVFSLAGEPYQPRRVIGTFEDNFDPAGGLNGNDGTLAWAGAWTAITNAAVVVNSGTNYEIRIDDAAGSALTRSFVVPAGNDQLTISYAYRAGAGDDTVAAQFSTNGSSWTTLASYITGSSGAGATNHTFTNAPGTRYFRFIKTALGAAGGTNEYIYFDNVSLLAETAPSNSTVTTDINGYYAFRESDGLLPSTAYQLCVANEPGGAGRPYVVGQGSGRRRCQGLRRQPDQCRRIRHHPT